MATLLLSLYEDCHQSMFFLVHPSILFPKAVNLAPRQPGLCSAYSSPFPFLRPCISQEPSFLWLTFPRSLSSPMPSFSSKFNSGPFYPVTTLPAEFTIAILSCCLPTLGPKATTIDDGGISVHYICTQLAELTPHFPPGNVYENHLFHFPITLNVCANQTLLATSYLVLYHCRL